MKRCHCSVSLLAGSHAPPWPGPLPLCLQFEPFSTPELLRVPLESVVLQIKMLFPHTSLFSIAFLDPPPEPALATALSNLLQHGALREPLQDTAGRAGGEGGAVGAGQGPDGVCEDRTELTELGRTLALLPVDVHLGKMLVSRTAIL